MTQDMVMGLGKEALWTALKVGAPLMAVSMIVGFVISALQAVTQINEASLAFVPKALASVVVLLFFGPWMLNTLVAYAASIFNNLPAFAR